MARVRIGTIGWLFAGWDRTYYPEDIPQEWKLGYYANELTAVVVPEDQWIQADPDQLEEMVEDVYEDFGFYFQIKTHWPTAQQCEHLKSIFAENFFGFLVDAESVKLPADVDYSDFIFPACLYPGSGCSWSQLGSQLERAVSSDCVIRVTAEADLRLLKQHFEQLAEVVDFSRDVLILVDVAEPDPDFIRQLRTLLELMMIA